MGARPRKGIEEGRRGVDGIINYISHVPFHHDVIRVIKESPILKENNGNLVFHQEVTRDVVPMCACENKKSEIKLFSHCRVGNRIKRKNLWCFQKMKSCLAYTMEE